MDFTVLRLFRVLGIGMLLLIPVLHAQTAIVVGTITRQNNKPAANVLVLMASKYRYTDVGGRYRIDGVPFGRHKVQITSGGRVLLEVEVNIRQAMSVVNLKLP